MLFRSSQGWHTLGNLKKPDVRAPIAHFNAFGGKEKINTKPFRRSLSDRQGNESEVQKGRQEARDLTASRRETQVRRRPQGQPDGQSRETLRRPVVALR